MGVYMNFQFPHLIFPKRNKRIPLGKEIDEYNDQCMRYLKMQIKRQKCALCLGAGVSVPIGLPTWQKLLDNLLEGIMARNLVEKAIKGNPAPNAQPILRSMRDKDLFQYVGALETAEYIQLQLEYIAERDANYNGVKVDPKHSSNVYMASSVRAALEGCQKNFRGKKDWSLLTALAGLILRRKGLRHIITYNYDDALEKAISMLLNQDFAAISRKGTCQSHNRQCSAVLQTDGKYPAHIYHVHGRIPLYTGDKTAMDNDIAEGVILSERSYQEMECNAYCATNTCQAQLFQTYSCLFIGFSAQDYNYRRIVKGEPFEVKEIRSKGKCIIEGKNHLPSDSGCCPPPHFIFYPVNALIKEVYAKVKGQVFVRHYREACSCILQSMLNMHRDYYQRHNIWPVYLTYMQLPDFIYRLY